MPKNNSLMTAILIILAAGMATYFVINPGATETIEHSEQSTAIETAENEQTELTVRFVVEATTYEIAMDPGSTAYDLMEKIQGISENFSFVGKEYPEMGFFVEQINGIAGDDKTQTYWTFYVNGEVASVGVSAYQLKNDDEIMWRYEHLTFE